MNITEELEQKGFKIDKLNIQEKETYFTMLDAVQKAQLTPDKLLGYITSMREAVTQDLVSEPAFIRIFLFKVENPRLIKLQARLQNYMLLEAFLTSPVRAEEQLVAMVGNLASKS